ncbi:MAG: thiamine pyrophosphate-dependent dehydrogenase E1 component subunit alpha [Chloroflexi bacterium]|nr:thiamine pyrophosphate-dependent dehydrogenase E1 component subunit alpha [Chloroflexota bacterium]
MSAENHISRHEALGLHGEDVHELYYQMVLTRTVDDRLWNLNRQGKVLAFASCLGQEAAQVGSAYALAPDDWLAISYREHGVVIARGMSVRDIFAYAYHRDNDPNTRGRQIPGHYGSQKLHILTASSPVGTQLAHGVGSAWASVYEGKREATIIYFGDGATSTGDFHAAANFAAVHKLPVVFLCQNNEWAISVPNTLQYAVKHLTERAAGYGMMGTLVDGLDVIEVFGATRAALARAYSGEGPTFVEAKCKRLRSHTTEDDDRRYRRREDVEADRAHDPLANLEAYMKAASLWDEGVARQAGEKAAAEVEDATQYAEASPLPKPSETLTHIFAEVKTDAHQNDD